MEGQEAMGTNWNMGNFDLIEGKKHCGHVQKLEQVAQRGYKISSPKSFKNQMGTALNNLI